MVDHYRPIHFLYWQKIWNLCLKVKNNNNNNKTKQNKTKQNKTKQKQNKKTTELSFLGTETQFSLEIWLQAYSWQRYEKSGLKVKKIQN